MENDHRKFILYADQDPEYINKAKEALDSGGYYFKIVTTGKEALQDILVLKPDLVVVDHNLKDISGEELYTRYLMSQDFKKAAVIPFIVLTTNGSVDKSKLYSLGFSSCLSKPFHKKDLIEFIEDVILSHQLKIEEVQFWETIRQSKDFLERVVESSADAIVTTDKIGYITYCNRAAEDLLDYNFDELVGQRASNFFKGGSSELLHINNFLQKQNKLQNYKTNLINKSGKFLPINMSISIMRNSSGELMGALGICKEMGAKKDTAIEKNKSDKLAAVLETAVAVNHAINNPLVPILGNAQFLLQRQDIQDEDIRRRLRVIVNNALRIREITQKLARISNPVKKEYIKGTMMLDIDAST